MPRPPWRQRIAFMAIVTAFLAPVGTVVSVGQLASANAAPIAAPSQTAIMQAAYPSVKIELVTAPSLYKFTFDAPAGLPSSLKGLVDSYRVTVTNVTGTHSMKSGLSKSGQTVSTLMADFGAGTNTISAQTTFKVASAGSSTTLSSATPAYPITPGSHAAGTLPSGGSDTGSGGVVSPAPQTGKCPSFQVFALRGSRGSNADDSDSDGVTNAFEKRYLSLIKDASFKPLHYDAIPVGYSGSDYAYNYPQSMGSGVSELQIAVRRFAHDCPGKPMGLIGYSQGADAVGRYLQNGGGADQGLIKWTVLLGDPAHNSHQRSIDAIPDGGQHDGVISVLPDGKALLHVFPSALTAHVRSYCMSGDPVCDYTAGRLTACRVSPGSCRHIYYVKEGWARDAANWAVIQSRRSS